MGPYYAGAIIPLVLALIIQNSKKEKKRGLAVDVGGETGYAIRNSRFASPVETAWEGVTTLAELFEQSCKKYTYNKLLGTRKLITKEVEISADGRSFEKVHLGDYEWLSFGQVFESVCNFASGLVQLGHQKGERAAIFADTCEEWFIALQGCFRRNVSVVTIYASLGEEALCHSFNETEVTTVICGYKELKKLANISGQLDTVKRIICMDDAFQSDNPLGSGSSSWAITSFSNVEKLGRQNPVEADLPLSADIAVIMYTSGSTGLPKGVMMTHGNVLATASAVMTIVPGLGNQDVYLAYLPLAHILELAAETLMPAIGSSIGYGSPLTLTDTSNKIKKGTKGDATILRPTLLAAVPAILDRVRDGVRKKIDATGGLSKKLFDLAYARRLSSLNGSWFGAWGLEKLLWDLLVFGKVQAILGGQIHFILSGAGWTITWFTYYHLISIEAPLKPLSHGNFRFTGRLVAKYAGDTAMYFVSKWLKKKYNITDECAALYEAVETWVDALNGRNFLGGVKPKLVDLAIYGVSRPICYLKSGRDMVEHTRIGDWYSRMEDAVGAS